MTKDEEAKIELVKKLIDNAWKAMDKQFDEAMSKVELEWMKENETKEPK